MIEQPSAQTAHQAEEARIRRRYRRVMLLLLLVLVCSALLSFLVGY